MSIEQILKQKLDRLSVVPDDFLSSLQKTEKQYYEKLLKLIAELELSQGVFVLSKANLAKLTNIEAQLKDLFLDTDFKVQVKKFIAEFDEQAKLNAAYFKKAFPGESIPKIADELISKKKESVAKLLLGDNLDANFINPIREQVELAVTSQASFSETLTSLQKIVTGDGETDSKIAQYAKQVAHDTFAVSDRAYTKIVSDELGAEWFKWSGNVIPTSRSICVENHNKFFHRMEIEEMADKDWSGKMEGTNTETIFTTAGGYNCRHSVLPVSINSVPQEVIDRAEKKGYYVPA